MEFRRGSAARRSSLIAAIATGALLLSACGAGSEEPTSTDAPTGDLDALVAAAQAEGMLTVYTGTADAVNGLMGDRFLADYGIAIEFVRLAGIPLIQRFEAEAESGLVVADVMINNIPDFYDDHPDWFVELDAEEVPGIDGYPEGAVQGPAMDFVVSPFGVQYNTDRFDESDIPDTWDGLVDRRFEGEVLLTDPRESGNYAGWADMLAEVYGTGFLEDLGQQGFEIINSGVPGAQKVAAGANGINFPVFPSMSQELIAQGAPIAFKALTGPSAVNRLQATISTEAPHPNAARLFLHWLLDEEVAEMICHASGSVSPLDPGAERFDCPALPDYQPIKTMLEADRLQQILDALGIRD